MDLKGLTVNFLGDSITEGFGIADRAKVYHQIIKEKYGLHCAHNYGMSFTRIARQFAPTPVNTKADLTFELRAEVMDRSADVVVVFGGTNDQAHGDAPFGTIDSTDIYTFCGAVNSLITKLKQDFPKSKLVFMTPIHRLDGMKPSEKTSKTLAEYADAILEICTRRNISVIDLYKINPIDPKDNKLFLDSSHPSEEGHRILAEIIGQELLKI